MSAGNEQRAQDERVEQHSRWPAAWPAPEGRSGTMASRANVPASVIPATVIALDAAGVATAIASLSLRAARLLADGARDEDVVVRAEGHEQHAATSGT
jgi:fatty acid-binding protein DegV